jgi:hypothetical protein
MAALAFFNETACATSEATSTGGFDEWAMWKASAVQDVSPYRIAHLANEREAFVTWAEPGPNVKLEGWKRIGGRHEARTRDLRVANAALSQLS